MKGEINYAEAWNSLKSIIEQEERRGQGHMFSSDLLQIMDTVEGECKYYDDGLIKRESPFKNAITVPCTMTHGGVLPKLPIIEMQ